MRELIRASEDYGAPIEEFLDSRNRNEWLTYDSGLGVYIRKSSRLKGEEWIPCVDVANLELVKGLRGKGIFTEWITRLEDIADARDMHVYVENLLNDRLAQFFLRRDYYVVSNHCNIPCMLRNPNQNMEWIRTPRRLVSAAIQKEGRIITGPRHYDSTMRSQIEASEGWDFWKGGVKQGFVDQMGHFYGRDAAWRLAEKNGQIIRKVSTPGTLYSENLY